MIKKVNNKKRTMKERTEKGSVIKMLNTFNNKIDDLEFGDFDESIDNKNHPYWMDDDVGFDIPDLDDRDIYGDEDFDESIDIDEARDNHTWGITYRDKSKRTKQHMVGASDAYDAKMKARKELGINFSDIDDIKLIEDFDEEDANICEAFKTYEDVLKAIKKTYGDSGVKAYELCLKLFEEETGVNTQNLKGKLVFTTNSRGPVSAASVANIKPATYIKMIESGEISALKSLMKYYYNLVGDPALNVNRLNENLIIEDITSSQASKIYSELKSVFDDFSDNMIETVESDYDSYKEMSDEDISFEEWFKETKTNYPDYFKYIFAIMFEDYLDGGY